MTVNGIDEVFRDQWGRLLSLLVAQYRRLDLAEDGLGDAFEAATRRWPMDGVPDRPAAWLLTTARRRVLDRLRAEAVAARKEPLLVVEQQVRQSTSQVMVDPGDVMEDELLRLVFLCAHPSLAAESASALTLRLVLGVPTRDIARPFLVSDATMAARLTRARQKLVISGVPFHVPASDALGGRLDTVATVAYLAFTAGYAPVTGAEVIRPDLAGEVVRLTRVVRELLPGEPVVEALLALMLLQHSRRDARVDGRGDLVLLADQDRSRWRHDEAAEGLGLLTPLMDRPLTGNGYEFFLQALIAAEHAVAPQAEDTDWGRIAQHYTELESVTGSPIVRLNRAVAVAEAEGAAAGLALLEGLDERLPRNHRLPAARAELLARAGDAECSIDWFDRAISLCPNDAERRHLVRRRASLGPSRQA